MSIAISLRLPEELIEDLKLLSGDGKYQKYMISLLKESVRKEISSKIPEVIKENELLKERIELLKKQSKCKHFWIGISENKYCSKCGVSD